MEQCKIQTGRVIKAYNSFFYVATECGLVTCKLRGLLKTRKRGANVVPGDFVRFSMQEAEKGVIEERLKRQTFLQRPTVANVTQVILTFAAAEPDLNRSLLDRFLVLAEWAGIPRIIICINKMDLLSDSANFLEDYKAIGYTVRYVSAMKPATVEVLREDLTQEVTVFAGPSGVGKSSLLNSLLPFAQRMTGQVSEKIKRGRHTTRAAELIPYQGGYLVDTPGFSSISFQGIEPSDLADCFPEFREYIGSCRFTTCTHTHEPSCRVKEAVAVGMITQNRYDSYVTIFQELHEASAKRWGKE